MAKITITDEIFTTSGLGVIGAFVRPSKILLDDDSKTLRMAFTVHKDEAAFIAGKAQLHVENIEDEVFNEFSYTFTEVGAILQANTKETDKLQAYLEKCLTDRDINYQVD
jgi:hypothetical protein